MTTILTVIRTHATHAGLPGQDGALIAVPLGQPQPCFVVVLTDDDGERLLSVHATEPEAMAQARRLEEGFAEAGLDVTPGGRVQ